MIAGGLGSILASLALAGTATPPARVQQRLRPTMETYAKVKAGGDTEATASSLDAALSSLLNDQSPVGDEALAVLLGFYIGEHPAEDIACELVHRGKRVEKYLSKYQAAEVALPLVAMPLPEAVRSEYPLVIRRVRAGERCTREP